MANGINGDTESKGQDLNSLNSRKGIETYLPPFVPTFVPPYLNSLNSRKGIETDNFRVIN